MPSGGNRAGAGRPKGAKDTKPRGTGARVYLCKPKTPPLPQSCAFCGEVWIGRKKKYCSTACGRAKDHQTRIKKESAPRICAHCGKTYTSKRIRFCSSECLLVASYKEQRSFPHTCPVCGENFNGPKKQKHCSDECCKRQNQRVSADGTAEKRCPTCGEWKQATEENYFHDKQRFDGFGVYCKPCSIKETVARSRTAHGKQLRKATNLRNADHIKAYARKIQPLMNARAKIRSRTDPAFQLNRWMRCLMWAALRKNKGGRKWQDLAGYSVDDLRRHLEKKFTPGMTWDRFLAGEVHIDHKVPRAAFNYSHPDDLDFKKCWALKNLQPLWALDNLMKSDNLGRPFQPSLAIGAL